MRIASIVLLLTACAGLPGGDVVETDAPVETDAADTDDPAHVVETGAGAESDPPVDTSVPSDPFADRVVSFAPGDAAGFGADALPDVVLGPPRGKGPSQGSLDVVSLGRGGVIVLGLDAPGLVDGPGVDLLVFENAFSSWRETGEVAVSDDGSTWHAWPCDAEGDGAPGCAGLVPVLSSPDNGVSPTDPAVAGGDGFDLADLGLPDGFVGRFVRITDSGANDLGGIGYAGTSGGFDLDAIAVVH